MSLLNSVLSSINGGQSAPVPSRSQSTSSVPRTNAPPRNPNNPPTTTNAAPKRKAEDGGETLKPKVAKIETNTAALALPPSRSTTTSPAQRNGLPPPKAQIPYRGTQAPTKVATTSRPTSINPVLKLSTSAASTTPTTPSSAPVPAKGGYLATLQRAKALADAQKQAGQIKHKPVEKLTKKDRQRMLEEAKAAAKGKPIPSSNGRAAVKGRSKSAEPVNPKTGAPLRERKKPVEVAYKGTMRSTAPAPAYRGTMGGPGGAAARKPASAPGRSGYGGGGGRRYASYSDEEEEEEEEEEQDYESESDMEAGIDEVYNEEETAARIARREDAAALAEETDLKRQKEARKRKLEELAAKQKKPRY